MRRVDKSEVSKALKEMSVYLQLEGEGAFKTRAYELAAERIASYEGDLTQLAQAGQLTQLPGIGESLGSKITELVLHGQMTALETLKQRWPPHILELLEVPELGPKKVKALHEQLQVGTLDELEQACRSQRVRQLKGFGEKTEEKILSGLAVARRALASGSRKRLGDVLPQAEALLRWVQQAPGVIRASLAGSVRRMKETVADVDIIASAADAGPVFSHFVSFPLVAERMGQGDSKASVRLRETDLQVDLRVLPDVDFATALHHFTGSKAHHIRLRGLALERDLTISEWGVFRAPPVTTPHVKGLAKHEQSQEKLPIASEQALYALLGMQYVSPELREDWGEIEAALAHAVPEDLVALEDIQGNIHAHTTWSDGRDSLEAMALKAQALGFAYLTITEHSQTSSYAGGLTIDRLKAQWDEIDRVQEKLSSLTLLKGVETDILENGALDYPEAVLEKLQVVIASIHQRYGQDESAMTRRILNAFDNPHVQIWGHPTGRLLLKREPIPVRIEDVLDKAAERGIAIEVNGCPDRLDLASEHIRKALQRKLKLVLSTDAHSVDELQRHLPFAVATARRGWARRHDVLNTQSVSAFLKSLKRQS